jgi:hypothetical protein
MNHQRCNTAQKIKNKYFAGFPSINEDEQLIDLAVVTFNNFRFLLTRIIENRKHTVAKEDRLLIFFNENETWCDIFTFKCLVWCTQNTVSRIFYTYLEELVSATSNLVFWPNNNIVQATMLSSKLQ